MSSSIPLGTRVIGFDGEVLGAVHEAFEHYLLVRGDGEHDDFEVPISSITGRTGDAIQVSVTRQSATQVDDEETAHRLNERA